MEAAQKQGVTAPEHPGDRETPDYTFKTDTGRTVTREEAAQIAKDAGQTIKEPVNGKLHSGDIEQPKTEQPDIRPKVEMKNGRVVPVKETEAKTEIVPLREGEPNWGSISDEISAESKTPLTPAPIRIQLGWHDQSGNGFGWIHAHDHAKAILKAGWRNVGEFLEYGLKNFNQIYLQENGKLMLVKRNGGKLVTIVQLQREGNFYGVTTAFPERANRDLSKNAELIWERSEPATATPGERSAPSSPTAPQSSSSEPVAHGAPDQSTLNKPQEEKTVKFPQPGESGAPGAAGIKDPAFTNNRIANYNADVDAKRVARGEEPLMKKAAQKLGDWWEKAMGRMEKNPNAGYELVDEISKSDKPVSNRDDEALLLHHRIDLTNKMTEAADRINDPHVVLSPKLASTRQKSCRFRGDFVATS